MSASESSFYVTGGTLRHDAPSYVERQADRDLYAGLIKGEFCYVLTSRQMGKSSLMVRTATKLREQGVNVITLDLTAIGQNVTPEQWYDGLIVRMGRHLQLEDELEDFWGSQKRLSPVQRWFTAIREVALPKRSGHLVLFVDEIDMVRSLPFLTDEFFSAIRECYNRRTEDPEFNRLTFCLLGVATPSDLIRDARITPFNIGRRIELTDFTEIEAAPLAAGLHRSETESQALFSRILYWTNGHPYLVQRLCRAVVEGNHETGKGPGSTAQDIDLLCEKLFLSSRAREQDDNLLFVRERILRSETDLASLLGLYEKVRNRQRVRDDDTNELINHLRLSGVVRAQDGYLQVRNRIYGRVFDQDWITGNRPDAELEKANGERVRIKGSCSIGRALSNEIALPDDKVSRRHALINAQGQNEFWLVDLGSANGTYLNGRRVTQPILLRGGDQIEIGQFRLTFHQSRTGKSQRPETSFSEKTIHEIKSTRCFLLVAVIESATEFIHSLSAEELPVITGRWIGECKQLIEECGGSINKFLGDGFFACWREGDKTVISVARALETLKRLQGEAKPCFRIVVHHGQVFESGGASEGQDSVLGTPVNFVFQMDKLAGTLKTSCLMSEEANRNLLSTLPAFETGRHSLTGFEGQYLFYTF